MYVCVDIHVIMFIKASNSQKTEYQNTTITKTARERYVLIFIPQLAVELRSESCQTEMVHRQ